MPGAGIAVTPAKALAIIGIILIIAAVAFLVHSGFPLYAGDKNTSGSTPVSAILPVARCSAGISQCNGKCVDLQNDADNCGACGFSVPYGQTCRNGQFVSTSGGNYSGTSSVPAGTTPAGSSTTSASAAEVSCPSGQSSCSGICRDLLTDNENCGSCNTICSSRQTCQNSRCLPPVTPALVVTTAAPVTITPELSCSRGEIICGSSCVNIFSSKEHCGVCDRACGSQEICVNARCGPACTEKGTTLCGETCVDLDTNIDNCGACGTECETHLPNAKGSLCSDGKCIISWCSADYGDCNEKIDDGCEVNLRIDARNCGSCGFQCPEGQVCYNKQCSKPIGT